MDLSTSTTLREPALTLRYKISTPKHESWIANGSFVRSLPNRPFTRNINSFTESRIQSDRRILRPHSSPQEITRLQDTQAHPPSAREPRILVSNVGVFVVEVLEIVQLQLQRAQRPLVTFGSLGSTMFFSFCGQRSWGYVSMKMRRDLYNWSAFGNWNTAARIAAITAVGISISTFFTTTTVAHSSAHPPPALSFP